MFRRRYLALAGSMAVAGCTGGSDGGDGGGDGSSGSPPTSTRTSTSTSEPTATPEPTPTDSPTPTDTPTATATPAPSVDLSVGDPEFVTVDLGYYSGKAAEVPVENTGTAPSGEIWLTFDWFDGDDKYVDSFPASCSSLGSGETWAARAYPNNIDATVEGVEVGIRGVGDPVTFGVDGVDLADSTFRASEERVLLRGAAQNTRESELRFLTAVGKVYAEDGTVLAADYTNETEIASGSTWRFEIQPWTVGQNGAAASGEILLTESSL